VQTEFESEKPDHQQKDTKKLASKKQKQNHTPTREVRMQPKTTTKQNHQTHY
jgi:hypothetical protein